MGKFILWLIAYLAALFLEVAVLPAITGRSSPALTLAVLVMAIASQNPRPGFWFAGLAGLSRDIAAPSPYASHALFAFAIFAVMSSFAAFSHWDEPLRRIGAAGAALIFSPLAWLLADFGAGILFGLSQPGLEWNDFYSYAALGEIIFAAFWFFIFAWITLARFRRRRAILMQRI